MPCDGSPVLASLSSDGSDGPNGRNDGNTDTELSWRALLCRALEHWRRGAADLLLAHGGLHRLLHNGHQLLGHAGFRRSRHRHTRRRGVRGIIHKCAPARDRWRRYRRWCRNRLRGPGCGNRNRNRRRWHDSGLRRGRLRGVCQAVARVRRARSTAAHGREGTRGAQRRFLAARDVGWHRRRAKRVHRLAGVDGAAQAILAANEAH